MPRMFPKAPWLSLHQSIVIPRSDAVCSSLLAILVLQAVPLTFQSPKMMPKSKWSTRPACLHGKWSHKFQCDHARKLQFAQVETCFHLRYGTQNLSEFYDDAWERGTMDSRWEPFPLTTKIVIEQSSIFLRQASFSVAGCSGVAPLRLTEATQTCRMLWDDGPLERMTGTTGPLRCGLQRGAGKPTVYYAA